MVLALVVLCSVGCGAPPDVETTDVDVGAEQEGVRAERRERDSGRPNTIVELPDTQYYAAKYPSIFQAQTNWIVEQRRALNIAFVVHEGDLVDADDQTQWNVASESMDILRQLERRLVQQIRQRAARDRDPEPAHLLGLSP